MKRFFCPNTGDLQKKKRSSVFHFNVVFSHGPRGHCPPLPPPLRGPGLESYFGLQYSIVFAIIVWKTTKLLLFFVFLFS